MKTIRVSGNTNPSGIVINDGYYALLGAILGLNTEESIHKICGVPYGSSLKRKYKRAKGKVEKSLVDADKMRMAMDRKCLGYKTLAQLVGCSKFQVYEAMHDIPKRVEWIDEVEKVLDVPQGSLRRAK